MLQNEILSDTPDCRVDKAESHEMAVELLGSWTYDLVILDIMGVRGFDLLKLQLRVRTQYQRLCSPLMLLLRSI